MGNVEVSKAQFRELFDAALQEAVDRAEAYHRITLPKDYIVELHGAGSRGEKMSISAAVDRLYISATLFWLAIDVAAIRIEGNQTVIFVRASGHDPGTWHETFYYDEGRGPFQTMVPMSIKTIE